MRIQTLVGKAHQNPAILAALLAMTMTNSVGARKISPQEIVNNPEAQKNYAILGAIEPTMAYIAEKRGYNLANEEDEHVVLQLIVQRKLNDREIVGVAKIIDTHMRVGNFGRGLESITGDRYTQSIALRFAKERGDYAKWAKDPQVMERFNVFQATLGKFLEFKPELAS